MEKAGRNGCGRQGGIGQVGVGTAGTAWIRQEGTGRTGGDT